MRRYLFDTGALSVILAGTIPDKWSRPWEEVKHGKGRLILLEQIVCELFYGNARSFGRKGIRDRILWLKSLREARILHPDDNDAFFAADLRMSRHRDLSTVDCFVLAVARSTRATLITNDRSVRDAAKALGVRVIWLPFR